MSHLLFKAITIVVLAATVFFQALGQKPQGEVNRPSPVNNVDNSGQKPKPKPHSKPKPKPVHSRDMTMTVKGVTFKMIYVEGGTFQMGATPEQGDDFAGDERPMHKVTVGSFLIGQTEVTQELWMAVMGTNPSDYKREKFPVEMVSWNDCQTFIAKLNQLTGQHFRLPTEAEWEFAARGGNSSRGYKYSGSNNLDEVAWYVSTASGTHPVGGKAANELGIYDMSGNVREWCWDWYDPNYYASSPVSNPAGPATGDEHVSRGGTGGGIAWACRVSRRDKELPTTVYPSLGLRLALSFSPENKRDGGQSADGGNVRHEMGRNM